MRISDEEFNTLEILNENNGKVPEDVTTSVLFNMAVKKLIKIKSYKAANGQDYENYFITEHGKLSLEEYREMNAH